MNASYFFRPPAPSVLFIVFRSTPNSSLPPSSHIEHDYPVAERFHGNKTLAVRIRQDDETPEYTQTSAAIFCTRRECYSNLV
jgi:hypothetical protein